MSTSRISLQLYTLRDAIAADLDATLARVSALGYTQVEPYGFADRVEEYVAALAATGLSAPSGHAPLLQLDDVAATFEAAARLGMTTVIDPFVAPDQWTTREQIEATAAKLNDLVPIAAQHGLTIGYHNHAWEVSERVDGVTAIEFFETLLDPAIVLEIDTYWSAVGGVPAPDLLARLGDRVRFIHVKDGDLTGDTKAQTAVGAGKAPIEKILAAAPTALRVVELDDFDGDVFEAVADSIRYLVSLGENA